MPHDPLPAPIRQFIGRHLRSVEQLEILLLLSSRPNESWTAQRTYDSILSSVASIQRWLDEFVRTGLFQSDAATPPSYRYVAGGEEAVQITTLAKLYKTMPVRVIEAIYKKDADPAQGFADAFKLKPNQ